jgi:hypothetical protein
MEKILQEINKNADFKEKLFKIYFWAIFEKSAKTAFYKYLKAELPKITKKASGEIFKAVESLFFQENKKAVEKKLF